MRTLLIFLLIVVSFKVCSQTQGQVFVPSYEVTSQIATVCQDIRQTDIGVDLIVYNLLSKPNESVIIDSLTVRGDTSIFKLPATKYNIELGLLYIGGFIRYKPAKVGVDSVVVTAHYSQYRSEGVIMFKSIQAPNIGMQGVSFAYQWIIQSKYAQGVYNDIVTDDTIHDQFQGTYFPSSTPQKKGWNDNVKLVSCGVGAIIDSIFLVGDFSEFEFFNLPKTPLELKNNDSVTISYNFVPKVVGKHPHHMVFHTTDGKNLVWSFEYEVFPDLSTHEGRTTDTKYHLYPNPANSSVTIGWQDVSPEEIVLIDVAGKPIQQVEIGASGFITQGMKSIVLDTRDLPNGSYSILVRSKESAEILKMVISQ